MGQANLKLTDDACQELISLWTDYLNDVMDSVNDVSEKMSECIKETKYEPILKTALSFEDFFNGELKNNINSFLEEWRESPSGISKTAVKMKNSEEAVEKAISLEQNIADCFETTWKLTVFDSQANVTDTDVNEEKIKDLADDFRTFGAAVDEIYHSWMKRIDEKTDENFLFVCLEHIVENVYTLTKGMDEHLTDSLSTLGEEFKESSDSQVSYTKDETANVSQRSEQHIQSLVDEMYKTEFDI